MEHPDIAPNLDVGLSCSFIFDDTPTADPMDIGNGDCSNKMAVQDFHGHGSHVASVIAAPINGVGIAGVAPDATLVGLKACTVGGFCFADSVAAALRYAGDVRLDVVNLSLFADPYLYYCKSDAEQRKILRELEEAARYAQQRGVLIGAATSTDKAGDYAFFDFLELNVFDGLTVEDGGARYWFLNGTSMASPHAAGVAALVAGQHPGWSPGAVKAAVQRSAQHLDCPVDWAPLGPNDERFRCYGIGGRTSFFGHGLVDAAAAAAK